MRSVGALHQLRMVDLEEVRGVWASRDEALLVRMTETTDHTTRALLHLDDERERKLRIAALEEILVGDHCIFAPSHYYHHAFLALVYELRTPLPGSEEVSVDSLFALAERLGPEDDLERFVPAGFDWPVPLPASEGYPLVGWVERQQVRALAPLLGPLRERAAALRVHDGDLEALDGLERIYSAAAVRERDIIVFQH